ncbi:MAG TPA: efflux transporter outer membrane subunit [Burkholderiaceae bacterium]
MLTDSFFVARRTAEIFAGRAALPAIAAMALLAGCASDRAIGPHETMPSAQALAGRLDLTAPPSPASEPSPDWWVAYGDPELSRWVERALADSPSLGEAGTRVAQAQALYETAGSATAPNVAFGADSTAQRFSETGIFPPPLGGMVHTINDVDVTATLHLDFFGRLKSRTEAARLSARAAAADRDGARAELAATVAQAYFRLARAQRSREIALATEKQRADILDLVQQRVGAGLDTLVEQRQAEGAIPQIRVDLEQADEQVALARHALAVLAGQPPQAADGLDAALPSAPSLAPPASLPIDLLARRADVEAAQLRVLASLREVDAARADFYPNVDLTALIGLNSLSVQHLFERASRTWQVGPAVHLPLFDGGRLRAELKSRSAETDAAVDAYDSAVLTAAREVSDTLVSIASTARQRQQQRLATEAAASAYDLALIRYKAGLGAYLTVLTAESNVLVQRRAQLELDARAAELDATLARALGGGFRAASEPLAAR